MTNLATPQSLLSRVLEAKGPDREIDLALFRAMQEPVPVAFVTHKVTLEWDEAKAGYFYLVPNTDLQVRYDPPAYTASIDAALALVERRIEGGTERYDLISRALVTATHRVLERGGKISDHLPLATIAALLRAEIAKLEATGSAAE